MKQLTRNHTKILIFALITIFALMIYLLVTPYYTLKLNHFQQTSLAIIIITIIPIIFIYIYIYNRIKQEKEYILILIVLAYFFIVCIIFGLPKLYGIITLNSNSNYITENIFVTHIRLTDYRARDGFRWNRNNLELQFADNSLISNKKLIIISKFSANNNECFKVKYRENALVIEVRPIENLGAMTKEECLNK